MPTPKKKIPSARDAARRKWHYRNWFKTFNDFVDLGMRSMTRSELAVYLTLLRNTRPDGTARAGLTDLANRGGMSVRQASRAVQKLIGRDLVIVIKPGAPGKATLYTVLGMDALKKLNPTAAKWVMDAKDATRKPHDPA